MARSTRRWSTGSPTGWRWPARPPTPAAVAAALRAEGAVLGDAGGPRRRPARARASSGAGPLDGAARRPGVTDVLVNGPSEVWVDRGDGLERAAVAVPRRGRGTPARPAARRVGRAPARRRRAVGRRAAARRHPAARRAARRSSPGGHADLPARRSPAGVRRSTSWSARGTARAAASPGCCARLVAARLSFLVTGGTGTGKTTLLSALLSAVDRRPSAWCSSRTPASCGPTHPHVVRLEARPPNVEGAGEVDLRDLVRQALRMRPDRLVVGEVRGAEVVELLAALNTGHEGGCGTVHANAPAAVPARLEALALAAGLGRDAVHSQLAAGLDAVVHLVRDRTGRRRVAEIGCLTRGPDGLVEVTAGAVVAGRRSAGSRDRQPTGWSGWWAVRSVVR